MSDKLNHSDLSALLAKEAGISVAKADGFTKAMFDLIIEGLEQDGIVKINGLGTFKVTEVADRFSVNVNTGEKFEIKGHRKLGFIPADALKDSVNQPFAMFTPVEVDDNYQDDADIQDVDEEQADGHDVTALPVEEKVAEEIPEEIPADTVAVENGADTAPVAAGKIPVEEIPEEIPADTVAVKNGAAAALVAAGKMPVDEIPEEIPADSVAVENGADAAPVAAGKMPVEEIPEEIPADTVAVENGAAVAPVAAGRVPAEEIAEEAPDDNVDEGATAVMSSKEEHPERRVDEETESFVSKRSKKSSEDQRRRERNGSKTAVTIVLMLVLGFAYYWFIGKENEEKGNVRNSRIEAGSRDDRKHENGIVVDNILIVESDGSSETAVTDTLSPADSEVNALVTVTQTSGCVETPLVATATSEAVQTLDKPAVDPDFVLVAELASRKDKDIKVGDTALYDITGEFAVHTVAEGENLAKISKIFYNSRKLWPYIAKHNNMSDPSDIVVGMKLSIPKLQPK